MPFHVKLHQLRAFVRVSESGSIRRASRELALSQPALTKSIKELEDGLSVQLFVRNSQGVILTEAGEGLYLRAKRIFEELRAAQDDILQRQGQLSGQINIGLGGSIARSIMPKVITHFHRLYPEVKIRIVEGQLVSMIHELRQGELDFTINTYYQGPYDQEFLFEKLLEKPFGIFCRTGHPAKATARMADLIHYDWTIPTPHGSYFKQLEDKLLQQAIMPKTSIICETFSSCVSLVLQNDFLTILPESLGNSPLYKDKLRQIHISEQLPIATYYLIRRRDTTPPPLTETLMNLFRRECQ